MAEKLKRDIRDQHTVSGRKKLRWGEVGKRLLKTIEQLAACGCITYWFLLEGAQFRQQNLFSHKHTHAGIIRCQWSSCCRCSIVEKFPHFTFWSLIWAAVLDPPGENCVRNCKSPSDALIQANISDPRGLAQTYAAACRILLRKSQKSQLFNKTLGYLGCVTWYFSSWCLLANTDGMGSWKRIFRELFSSSKFINNHIDRVDGSINHYCSSEKVFVARPAIILKKLKSINVAGENKASSEN